MTDSLCLCWLICNGLSLNWMRTKIRLILFARFEFFIRLQKDRIWSDDKCTMLSIIYNRQVHKTPITSSDWNSQNHSAQSKSTSPDALPKPTSMHDHWINVTGNPKIVHYDVHICMLCYKLCTLTFMNILASCWASYPAWLVAGWSVHI